MALCFKLVKHDLSPSQRFCLTITLSLDIYIIYVWATTYHWDVVWIYILYMFGPLHIIGMVTYYGVATYMGVATHRRGQATLIIA